MYWPIFGYISTACISIAMVPQIAKTIRTRDVRGISLHTYLIADIGNISALIYGYAIASGPVIVTSWLTLAGSLTLTWLLLFSIKRTLKANHELSSQFFREKSSKR